MNSAKLKTGMIGIGIVIFLYLFNVLHHNNLDIVGAGMLGMALIILVSIAMCILYLTIVYLIEEYDVSKHKTRI